MMEVMVQRVINDNGSIAMCSFPACTRIIAKQSSPTSAITLTARRSINQSALFLLHSFVEGGDEFLLFIIVVMCVRALFQCQLLREKDSPPGRARNHRRRRGDNNNVATAAATPRCRGDGCEDDGDGNNDRADDRGHDHGEIKICFKKIKIEFNSWTVFVFIH